MTKISFKLYRSVRNKHHIVVARELKISCKSLIKVMLPGMPLSLAEGFIYAATYLEILLEPNLLKDQ